MVVVLLSCSSKLRSYCQKVLLIGIFGFQLENLVFFLINHESVLNFSNEIRP